MSRTTVAGAGYSRSDVAAFSIGNGANGSAVTPFDFGRNYAFLLVRCADCQFIPADTTFGLSLAVADADSFCALYDDDGVFASPTLPTSGTFQYLIPAAAGVQRGRIVLSNNASGGAVAFEVYGIDAGVED